MLITLGVASSISSYKAVEILREFQKAGHSVRVAMTRSATRFIRPILFQSLSRHPVYLDEFRAKKGEVMHVDLARETNLFVVAPATANVIGKFAGGIADDFLSTFYLACRSKVLVAPAMNVYMYRHPVVQRNIALLRQAGVEFIEPDEGYLACGDEGAGRLAPVEEIVRRALALLNTATSLQGKRVLVTAGPTWEALDPIRVLTNRSSGRMGFAMAEEAVSRGASVTLVCGPTSVLPPLGVKLVRVESAAEMKNAVLATFDQTDYVIKAAAVSDYRPSSPLTQKKKKTGEEEILQLQTTDDILEELSRRKSSQILVGFCAETEDLEKNARKKLERKKLDFIVANVIEPENDPFQSEQNRVLVLTKTGDKKELPLQKKRLLATQLWDFILEQSSII